jgi:hypothetical protein
MAEDSEVGLAAAAHLLGFAQMYSIDWLYERAVHRATQLMNLAESVRAEGERDPLGEKWEPHGLDPMTARKMTKVLSRNRQIRRCYLVRRVSSLVPLWIAYVLVVRSDADDPSLARHLGEIAESILPEERPVRVLLVARDSDWERRATEVAKAPIHLIRRRTRSKPN